MFSPGSDGGASILFDDLGRCRAATRVSDGGGATACQSRNIKDKGPRVFINALLREPIGSGNPLIFNGLCKGRGVGLSLMNHRVVR